MAYSEGGGLLGFGLLLMFLIFFGGIAVFVYLVAKAIYDTIQTREKRKAKREGL